jgi:peptide subunit release factor RF-3
MEDRASYIAFDKKNRPVFMAESAWIFQMAQEKYPDMEFHVKAEY